MSAEVLSMTQVVPEAVLAACANDDGRSALVSDIEQAMALRLQAKGFTARRQRWTRELAQTDDGETVRVHVLHMEGEQ